MGRKGKRIQEPTARVHIEWVDDPILYRQLMSVILLAIELADKDKEEAEKIQKKWLEEVPPGQTDALRLKLRSQEE